MDIHITMTDFDDVNEESDLIEIKVTWDGIVRKTLQIPPGYADSYMCVVLNLLATEFTE